MNPTTNWFSPMANDDRWQMLEWLEESESQAASTYERAIEDDATLGMLAAGWRSYFAAKAAIPPAWRYPGIELDAGSLQRGGGVGGLGSDYPIGMFNTIRAGWVMSVRGLMAQQMFFPDPRGLADLVEVADAIDAQTPSQFAPHSGEVVALGEEITAGRCELRRVRTDAEVDETAEPILVVASMINRWYILDFLEGQSFLGMLGELGRPVYVLAWLPPADEADDRSLADLVAGPLRQVVQVVLEKHSAETLNLVGYCMGGTLVAAFAAAYPDVVARLSTVCGPVEFAEGGAFRKWFSPQYLDVELAAASSDRVPAALVHLPFWWLRPTIKLQKAVRLVKSKNKAGYIERFLASETWNHDNVDMARGVFRSWAGDLYQNDALVNGAFIVDSEAVDLARIQCPTLVVAGEYDAITPADSADALARRISSEYAEVARVKGSHTGVLTNPRLLAEQKQAYSAWLSEPADGSKEN